MVGTIIASNPNQDKIQSSVSEIPLWLFGLGEIILYDCGVLALQYLFAISCYVWLFLMFCKNIHKGIIYFFAFNILTLGIFNFWRLSGIVSYWGLRFGGVSVNILFTAILTLLLIIKRKGRNLLPTDQYSIFFYVFYLFTLIVGIFMSLIGKSYFDNLFNDILTFTPMIFYAVLVKELDVSDLKYIVLKIFSITIFAMVLAYVLNKRYEYADQMFIVGNTMSFLSPVGVVVLWRYYKRTTSIMYCMIMAFLLIMEAYFAGGKTIIMIGLILFWLIARNKRVMVGGTILLFITYPFLVTWLNNLAAGLDNPQLAFKITQITQVLSDDTLMTIAMSYSSMGNVIAEGITLIKYYIENPEMLLWGQGMGAGIPDFYGFLQPFAGKAGYNAIDAVRDNYFNLHIAPYKVLANGGILIFIWYCKILWDLFSQKNAMAFMAFLMFSLMFYVSKEFFLLTYILMLIVENNHDNEQNISIENENFSH